MPIPLPTAKYGKASTAPSTAELMSEQLPGYDIPATDVGTPSAAPTLSGQKVNMIGADGKSYAVPIENAQKASQIGFKIETAQETADRQFKAANDNLPGAVRTGLHSFVNEGTLGAFGAGEKIVDPKVAHEEELLEQVNPGSHYLGSALGIGASTALTAGTGLIERAGVSAERAVLGEATTQLVRQGVSEIAAPSIARQILGSGAKLATEGALYAAPKAATEAALGDPEAAGETLLTGIGVGGTLGILSGGIGAGFGAAKSALLEHTNGDIGAFAKEHFSTLAEEQAWRSINPLAKATKEASRGMTGVDGQRAVGRTLLDLNAVKTVGEDATEYAERLAEKRSQIGSDIGNAYKALDEKGVSTGLTAGELIGKIEDQVYEPLTKKFGHTDLAAKFKGEINEMRDFLAKESNNGELTFEQLHKFRADLQEKIYTFGKLSPSPIEGELQSVRALMTKELEEKGEAVAKIAGEQFIDPIRKLNTQYRHLTIAEQAVQASETYALKNRAISLSDYIGGGTAASIGAKIGSFAGPTGTAVGGAIGGAVGAFGNKFLRQEGNALSARVLDGQFGLNVATKAFQNGQSKLAAIPDVLNKLSANGFSPKPVILNGVPRLLNQEIDKPRTKKERQEDFNKISASITNAASDPQRLTNATLQSASVISPSAPAIAQAYANQQAVAINYLHKALPKPTTTSKPFNHIQFVPTDDQLSEFEQKAAVVADPHNAIKSLEDGMLSTAQVDALKNVYPQTYKSIKDHINNYAAEHQGRTMNYAVRNKLGLLLGDDLDDNTNNSIYQSSFAVANNNDNVNGFKAKIDTKHQPTAAQRISSS